jgi:hypothetical protein
MAMAAHLLVIIKVLYYIKFYIGGVIHFSLHVLLECGRSCVQA